MGLPISDYNMRLILLSVIPLSGGHCIYCLSSSPKGYTIACQYRYYHFKVTFIMRKTHRIANFFWNLFWHIDWIFDANCFWEIFASFSWNENRNIGTLLVRNLLAFSFGNLKKNVNRNYSKS